MHGHFIGSILDMISLEIGPDASEMPTRDFEGKEK